MSSSIEPIEYKSRLREITAVLRRHNITKRRHAGKAEADSGRSGPNLY